MSRAAYRARAFDFQGWQRERAVNTGLGALESGSAMSEQPTGALLPLESGPLHARLEFGN